MPERSCDFHVFNILWDLSRSCCNEFGVSRPTASYIADYLTTDTIKPARKYAHTLSRTSLSQYLILFSEMVEGTIVDTSDRPRYDPLEITERPAIAKERTSWVWVPSSLANPSFTASPCPLRTVTPIYDHATSTRIEERDGYAEMIPLDTNSRDDIPEPGFSTSKCENGVMVHTRMGRAAANERHERAHLARYAPYHPKGWTGRLPG